MLVTVPDEAIDLQCPLVVALEDVVFVPPELRDILDRLPYVAQTLRFALRMLVEALDGLHIEFGHQSTEHYTK